MKQITLLISFFLLLVTSLLAN